MLSMKVHRGFAHGFVTVPDKVNQIDLCTSHCKHRRPQQLYVQNKIQFYSQ